MRFSDIFLRCLRRPTPRTCLLLDRVSLAGVGLAIARILEPLQGTHRNPKQVGRPLAQETLLETMAERALSFADCPLGLAGSNRSEDDLLAEVRAFLHRHLTDIRGLLLNRWRIGFHLGQPVSEPGQTGRHEEHEAADLEKNAHALEIHGHGKTRDRKHDEGNRQESRLARDAGALIVEVRGVIGDRNEEHRVAEQSDYALEHELAPARIVRSPELKIQHQADND